MKQGLLPCLCRRFVNLMWLANNSGLNYGYCELEPTIYAIVECAEYVKNPDTNIGG